MTTLNDKKKAFFHVIDSHRWLAVSGCAWNLAGPNARGATKVEAHRLIPNVDVMIRDCLLLHARSLINFYTDDKRGITDIVLSDFSLRITSKLGKEVARYRRPIDVHLLHLTDWRDPDYRRNRRQTKGGAQRFRLDWNREAARIAEKLIECLEFASQQSGRWEKPFKELYDATAARYGDKSHEWPKNLCEKAHVEQYLKGLRL